MRQHGIRSWRDRPGVGANLQDHLQLRLIYKVDGIRTLNERYHAPLGLAGMLAEYVLFRRGPLTMAPSQLGPVHPLRQRSGARQSSVSHPALVARSVRRAAAHVSRLYRERCNLRPTSRGRCGCVRAIRPTRRRSSRIIWPPTRTAASRCNAIRVTRRIVAQPALGAVPSRRISARRRLRRRRRAGADESRGRYRHHHLSSGRHREDGACRAIR